MAPPRPGEHPASARRARVVECHSHRLFSRVKQPPGLTAGLTGASGPQSQAAKVRLHPTRCPLFLEQTPCPCRSCTRNLPCPDAPHPNPGTQRSRAVPSLKPRSETWKERGSSIRPPSRQVLIPCSPPAGHSWGGHNKPPQTEWPEPQVRCGRGPTPRLWKVLPASSSPWGLQLPWL